LVRNFNGAELYSLLHYKWLKPKWDIHLSLKPNIYTKQITKKRSVNMSVELNVATISVLLLLMLASTANALTRVFDVRNYGAKPNLDITQVFSL
jgi:hypothetical protein